MWAAAVGAGAGDKVPPPDVIRDRVDDMLADRPVPEDADLRRLLGVL